MLDKVLEVGVLTASSLHDRPIHASPLHPFQPDTIGIVWTLYYINVKYYVDERSNSPNPYLWLQLSLGRYHSDLSSKTHPLNLSVLALNCVCRYCLFPFSFSFDLTFNITIAIFILKCGHFLLSVRLSIMSTVFCEMSTIDFLWKFITQQ